MSNTNNLFKKFNSDLQITSSKNSRLVISRESIRNKIKEYFEKNHSNYSPKFWIQGSYKMGTTIRTKDNTCDIDDGVYFDENPDNISCTTLQTWVKEAVDGITDDISHRQKCITVNYKADYNIDLPVYLRRKNDNHPYLAVKDKDWREDDPREMVEAFKEAKKNKEQLLRIVRYLKAWCDEKREKMPSGLAMTILAMNNIQTNDRDDVALKFTLIEIQKTLKTKFECIVPATPYDNIFEDYDQTKKNNFMDNLSSFISDAKKAIDKEKNYLKASKLWKKHLGDRFPEGEDKDEEKIESKNIVSIIDTSKPYYGKL